MGRALAEQECVEGMRLWPERSSPVEGYPPSRIPGPHHEFVRLMLQPPASPAFQLQNLLCCRVTGRP